MIIDQNIDEVTAKYWCAFKGIKPAKSSKVLEAAANEKSKEKEGIVLGLAADAADKKGIHESESLNENWFTELLKSPPAWVDEPTGFQDVSPEGVFDDPEAGVEGYNKGAIGAAATAAIAIPPVRHAIVALGKQAVKHPISAIGVGAVASHPKETLEAAKALKDTYEDNKDLIESVKDFFGNFLGWCADHKVALSLAGSICYGLYKTMPLWMPYAKRLAYEITSGKQLAVCTFTANDIDYKFEYTTKKNKWILLSRGKIASREDSMSFVQTQFAQKFIAECWKTIHEAISSKNAMRAMLLQAGDNAAVDRFDAIVKDKKAIEANLKGGKIIAS